MKPPVTPTSFRFPPEFLREVDRYAAKKSRETGVKWSRVAAIRFLVKSALEQQDIARRSEK